MNQRIISDDFNTSHWTDLPDDGDENGDADDDSDDGDELKDYI